ncbi:MAG: hypothetical protein DRI97_14195, partial [Bacteroidetes bacterium]
YPIGTMSYYRPLTVNFNSLTNGSLIAGFNPSAPGTSGLPVDDAGVSIVNTFVEGYWELARANSLNSSDYNIDLTGNGFTTFPIIDATRIVSRSSSGSDWTASGTHIAAVGNTASRNNVNILTAELALADTTNCSIPVTSAISGPVSVCTGTTGTSYSVIHTPGSTYTWTVAGGSITSSQGLNFIFMDWGPTGMVGSVEVVEDNGCGLGAPVLLDVDINPVPTSSISGNIAVASGASGEIYTLAAIPGYTYTWSIVGDGTITSGQGTGSISVDWGVAGTALISVVGGNGCGSAAPEELGVDVFDIIVSAQTGNWNIPATWVGGVVPTAATSARIAAGHTVTTTATRTINNLIIDATAVLNSANFYFYINGNYTLNGEHQGSADYRVRLNGLGSTIDGTGVYNHTGILYIGTGNKIIASTADLTINDALRLNDNIRVTNYGRIALIGYWGLWGDNLGATWINAENSYLYVDGVRLMNNGGNGSLTASATGNTVVYARANNMLVETPTGNTYHNLTIAGTFTKTMQADLSITGDLTISSTLNANNFDLDLGGDWTNNGYFTEGTGTVSFNGSSDQSLSIVADPLFNNLTIDKNSGTVVLNDDVQVGNTLSLLNGNVNANGSILTLGTSTASTGTLSHFSGTILGMFERWVNTTGLSYEFPVGSAANLHEMLINFGNLTNGSIVTEFISAAPGNAGLPLTDGAGTVNNIFTEGYWSTTRQNGMASTDYNLDIIADGFTSFTIDTSTRIVERLNSASDWTVKGTHVNAVGNNVKRVNINTSTLTSEFALGDPSLCTLPDDQLISGASSVCKDATGSAYSVIDLGNTYTWTVTGGSIASGQGNSSITVDWGSTGMLGEVRMVETNVCGSGNPAVLDVSVSPLPTSIITGKTAVAENSGGEQYSVLPNVDYTYTWSITGGSVASGQDSDIITVDWGSAGVGDVTVVASNVCGAADPETLPVSIYDVIVSAQTGNWNVGTTWVGGVVPGTANSAVIDDGHTVTVTSNDDITNITINATATLNTQGFIFNIYGDYNLNGIHSSTTSDRVRLYGLDTYIDGAGSFTGNRRLYIVAGNKVITPTANLTLSGSLRINSNLIVT